MALFPTNIRRRQYYANQLSDGLLCPECGKDLIADFQTYIVAVKGKEVVSTFAVGTEFGFFCQLCPVVVLDEEGFAETIIKVIGNANEARFSVLGIVDHQGSEEELRQLLSNSEENPIPFVEFIQGQPNPKKRDKKPPLGNKKHKRRKHPR